MEIEKNEKGVVIFEPTSQDPSKPPGEMLEIEKRLRQQWRRVKKEEWLTLSSPEFAKGNLPLLRQCFERREIHFPDAGLGWSKQKGHFLLIEFP